MPAGRHEEQVIIYTDDPVYRQLTLPVTVIREIRGRISALPAEVKIDEFRLVRICDSQDQPVTIENAVSDHPAVVCSWAGGPGNHATLKVVLDHAKANTAQGAATVRIEVSSPVREVLTIPVRWTAR
jgi:hypothetical protein